MGFFTMVGNQVSNLGGALNLPEFGISERINSIGYKPTSWNTSNPVNQQVQAARIAGVPITTKTLPKVLGYSTDTPKLLAPQQQSQPTAQRQPISSGFNVMDRNANPGPGYFYDAADGWKPTGGDSGGGGGGGGGSDPYAGVFSFIDQRIGEIGGMRGDAESRLRQAADLQRSGINEQMGYSLDNLNKQRGTVGENQANTLADLNKSLRDSTRNVQMLLGARGANGSANDAASYALTKLYGNQRADVMQQSRQQLGDIDGLETQLRSEVSQRLNDVDTWLNSSMGQVAQQYDQLKTQWQTMSANARMQSVAELQARAQYLQDQATQYRMGLEEGARNRLMQLNDYKMQLANRMQYTPEQQVYQEYGFSPSNYQYDQSLDFNPLSLARNKKRLGQA